MKKPTKTHVTTRFGPEVHFEVDPVPSAETRRRLRSDFDRLQRLLIDKQLHHGGNDLLRQDLEDVANEAAAIAWTTPYPALVMPVLFEEKTRTHQSRVSRQLEIREESRALMDAALA